MCHKERYNGVISCMVILSVGCYRDLCYPDCSEEGARVVFDALLSICEVGGHCTPHQITSLVSALGNTADLFHTLYELCCTALTSASNGKDNGTPLKASWEIWRMRLMDKGIRSHVNQQHCGIIFTVSPYFIILLLKSLFLG